MQAYDYTVDCSIKRGGEIVRKVKDAPFQAPRPDDLDDFVQTYGREKVEELVFRQYDVLVHQAARKVLNDHDSESIMADTMRTWNLNQSVATKRRARVEKAANPLVQAMSAFQVANKDDKVAIFRSMMAAAGVAITPEVADILAKLKGDSAPIAPAPAPAPASEAPESDGADENGGETESLLPPGARRRPVPSRR